MSNLSNPHRRSVVTGTLALGASALIAPLNQARAQTIANLYQSQPLEDKIMGDPQARVTLLEYASMTCPHCKAFHEQILPTVKEKYIEKGTVKYILRPFPFNGDRKGEAAFMLANCAPNDGYYPMLHTLFITQDVWSRSKNPVPELKRIAKMSGMTDHDFNTCLRDQKLYAKIIQGRNLAIKQFKVRATPTVFINSELFKQTNSVDAITAALDEAVANQT